MVQVFFGHNKLRQQRARKGRTFIIRGLTLTFAAIVTANWLWKMGILRLSDPSHLHRSGAVKISKAMSVKAL